MGRETTNRGHSATAVSAQVLHIPEMLRVPPLQTEDHNRSGTTALGRGEREQHNIPDQWQMLLQRQSIAQHFQTEHF